MTFQDSSEDLNRSNQLNSDILDEDPSEQWFFQFSEHLLLTVQAIHRLHEALTSRMP